MSDKGPIFFDSKAGFTELRRFQGSPREFWALYLRGVMDLAGGARASLCVRVIQTDPGGHTTDSWRLVASHPAGGAPTPDASLLKQALAEGVARVDHCFVFSLGGTETGDAVVVLELGADQVSLSLADLADLLGATPALWQAGREHARLQERLALLATALDLSLVISAEPRFRAAVFTICNELCARLHSTRVSLGWQQSQVLRLCGMSQTDKFDARTEFVRNIEVAMEETADQDHELRWPAPADSQAVVREHGQYARQAGVGYLCSIPLRWKGQPEGVLLLERDIPFQDSEVELLRVVADQVGPRLAELRQRDRPWPLRLYSLVKEKAAALMGPRHTGAKLAGAVGAAFILFLVFGRLPYSVEAPAQIRSGHVVFVTAPIDGFIENVFFDVGETRDAGDPLLTLDTRELLVQQAGELANLNQYRKEAERARAEQSLADLRIAEAQIAQAEAALAQTAYRLEQSHIQAPIGGVVVEGELRKRLGSPVRQGEVLLQLADLSELYVQIEAPEDEIHYILGKDSARIRFAADIHNVYPLQIVRIAPAGVKGDTGITFDVRARSEGSPPDWWRPGMSGTAKIRVGWRNAGWILTHRSSAWLRKNLWW